ncbi:hypothetical protein A3E06_02815 [Candidatus Giovannonibacteria bacterium RIFCSPHIGHO2_12_FULL_44_42]|nr:MAG: hypothetical protein A3E06_02815 [Candidatus Giovannonibacteria bacterium RIFCSPHIGHO2_12_FULL_44_42]
MPAAAVIRGARALSGFTGRKGCVGGMVSPALNLHAQHGGWVGNGQTWMMPEASGTQGVGVKSVDILGNTKGEGSLLGHS